MTTLSRVPLLRWTGLLALSVVACGGHYEVDSSEIKGPTATLNFAGSDPDYPSGYYFLDVMGVFDNGSATGGCGTTFSGCFAINPGATPPTPLPANSGEAHAASMEELCSGNWVFTDTLGTSRIKLRDTNNDNGSCLYTVPEIAVCVVDGTFTAPTAAATLVDLATDLSPSPGFRVRLRPGENYIRVTCTLTNAAVTFDIGIN